MARRQVTIFVNGKEVETSLKNIDKEMKVLRRTMRENEIGSEKYEEALKRWTTLSPLIEDHKKRLKGVESTWDSLKTGAGKFLNVSSIASAAGLAGITLGAEAAVSAIIDVVEETKALRREITQTTGAVGDELDTITIKTRAIARTFQQTESEVVQSANTLAKEFGISYSAALDLISEGFLQGANNSDEFLENIKEYSTQFREAGYSADGFIQATIQATKEGIFSDKGIDAVKEFGLRIREQTVAVQDALDKAFGKAFTDKIFKGINDGSISTQQALKLVATEMGNTEIPANRLQTVIADVFGAPGEDAGLRFILQLGEVGDTLENTSSRTNDYIEAQRELLAANENLATSENDLTKQLTSTSDALTVFWTNLKSGAINVLVDVLQFFEQFTATLGGLKAAFKQLLQGGLDSKSVGKAYKDAYLEGLDEIEIKRKTAEAFRLDEEQKKDLEKQVDERRKLAAKAAEKTRQEQKRQQEQDAKALESAQKRLTDIVEKYGTERTLAALSEEDRKLEEIRLKYEEAIQLAKDLEAKGVAEATAQRLELEAGREAALLAQREEFAKTRAEKEKEAREKAAKEDLDFRLEEADARAEAQKEIDEAIRESLLEGRELAVQELELHYQQLLELARKNGIDTAELELAHRKELEALNLKFDKEELDTLAENQARRAELLRQSFTDLAGAIDGLLGTISSDSKQFVALQKALTLAQIAIDTASAISSLTRNSEANPANAVTFGAAGAIQFATGLIRVLANIAKAKQVLSDVPQRRRGGYATVRGQEDRQVYHAKLIGQPLTGMLDYPHPVLTASGILANERGREYYVSHSDLRNPRVLDHVRAIDNITQHKQRAAGGFASTSPAQNAQAEPAGTDPALLQTLQVQNQLLVRLLTEGVRADIGNDEILALQRQAAKLDRASGGRLSRN